VSTGEGQVRRTADSTACVAVDYGGYAVTLAVSQLPLGVTVSSICPPASSFWTRGRLGKGLSDFEGTSWLRPDLGLQEETSGSATTSKAPPRRQPASSAPEA